MGANFLGDLLGMSAVLHRSEVIKPLVEKVSDEKALDIQMKSVADSLIPPLPFLVLTNAPWLYKLLALGKSG